jgi:CMP-N-acetylneuraminic acid synthetase
MIIFIPIKHNSQRVHRKNFRIFCNEPLYKHTLLKLKNHTVFVDTDSEEIIDEIHKDSRMKHVSAYKRNKLLIGHEISVCELIKDFIIRFDIKEPITQIHVTSPFLEIKTLEKAYNELETHDSVASCNEIRSRFWRKETYGFCPVNHNPLKMEQTQDLPCLYEENSAFYMFYPDVIKTTGNRIGKNPKFYKTSYPENLDIDTEEDWKYALEIIK